MWSPPFPSACRCRTRQRWSFSGDGIRPRWTRPQESFFAAAAVDGGVYVVGGHDARKNALRTAEVYDVEADEWRKLPEMAEERDECHGIVLKDENNSVKFWVVSGYGTESQGRFRSDGEYYNPETNTWVKIENIWPYAGDSPKYTVVTGDSRWMSVINGDVKEFDFEEKAWKTVNMGRIPKSVSGSSSISMVDVGGGRMMVMGNGERCGDGGCDGGGECKEEGCGGEGVYMVEEKIREEGDKKGEIDWNWEHVHAPNNFLGFPFSSSHLLI
ncbi:hypothetical protein RND81_12G079300 [Saponaria officinalis]|uniref:Uncharacterized protein n=1 Tax=Saponaria officinalis TaxID=3572 RepID=A0AAW1H7W8_SAPOF